jgi:glutathione S-transferase
MKLYFAPGACSIGIHFLLEEIGIPFERQKVNIRAEENFEPWFVALNPKAKVPLLLRDDGSTLTEFPTIARYLAELVPASGLLPDCGEKLLRASELLDFLASTVHMQGFSRIFRPDKFAAEVEMQESVRQRGREIVTNAFNVVGQALSREPLAGVRSFADAGLLYTLFWAARLQLDVPEACRARYAELKARPAAIRAFAAEEVVMA